MACPAGKFPNAANTAGCEDCDANCNACGDATTCTAAAEGYYLDSVTDTGETNP